VTADPVDAVWNRALRRSAQIRARLYTDGAKWESTPAIAIVSAHPKLPLGEEPASDSADWRHRFCVRPARPRRSSAADPTLHLAGFPRPHTRDGWPLPFTGVDGRDPCATDRRLEERCGRDRSCQVCGLPIAPGEAFAVRRLGHQHAASQLPWVEGRSFLHERCLRLSLRWCPELIRQVVQGVADVVREPRGCTTTTAGTLLDTRDFQPFLTPVWPLELARDRGDSCAHQQLERAARINQAAAGTVATRAPAFSVGAGALREPMQ
jgi:hypothetical protein